jgi:hypothetical protein
MLDERTRRTGGHDVAVEAELVDAWAAELTAIAYGSVPSPHGVPMDAVRGAHLTLVSSMDEPVSISSPDEPVSLGNPGEPLTGLTYDRETFDSQAWRGEVPSDAAVEQLARDIVAITQARDALMVAEQTSEPAAAEASVARRAPRTAPLDRGTQDEAPLRVMFASPAAPPAAFRLRRTPDSVPVILGSVLGFLMITIFSVAAVFIKFAR